MNKKNIILIVIAIITLLSVVTFATFAYFAGASDITGKANLVANTEQNNMVFDTVGGEMQLNVTAANMQKSKANSVAEENNTTLTVNFQANTAYDMVCTYDIVFEWTSSNKYTAHSSGVTGNEFTIQASLASNSHVTEGTNSISTETDFADLTYTNNKTTVVSGAKIDASGVTISTAVWTLDAKFYNNEGRQNDLANKTYAGNFKVENVSCVAGTVSGNGGSSSSQSGPTSYSNDFFLCYENENYECYFDGTPGTSLTYPLYSQEVNEEYEECKEYDEYDEYCEELPQFIYHYYYTYVGQDDSQYYVCGYSIENEKQLCLSQSYRQYGLSGHNAGNYFTLAEQASAKHALWQAFYDAGISIEEERCLTDDSYVYCYADTFEARINYDGSLYIFDRVGGYICNLYTDGGVDCASN